MNVYYYINFSTYCQGFFNYILLINGKFYKNNKFKL
jgi:hypothetical protein